MALIPASSISPYRPVKQRGERRPPGPWYRYEDSVSQAWQQIGVLIGYHENHMNHGPGCLLACHVSTMGRRVRMRDATSKVPKLRQQSSSLKERRLEGEENTVIEVEIWGGWGVCRGYSTCQKWFMVQVLYRPYLRFWDYDQLVFTIFRDSRLDGTH